MTKDEAKSNAEILQAYSEGKTIQFKTKGYGSWQDHDGSGLAFNFGTTDYRIKIEPKLPTYRPWRVNEIPLGAWYRTKNRPDLWTVLITGADPQRKYPIRFACNEKISADGLDTAFHFREHSVDNGKTWLPCGILE